MAAQERGKGVGRVRLRVVSEASAGELPAFITQNIEPGSAVHADAWRGYAQVGKNVSDRPSAT